MKLFHFLNLIRLYPYTVHVLYQSFIWHRSLRQVQLKVTWQTLTHILLKQFLKKIIYLHVNQVLSNKIYEGCLWLVCMQQTYCILFVENVHCNSLTLSNKQRYPETLYQPLRNSNIHASILLIKQVFETKNRL
jgi:hypothetical protein